jgi:hypothetical protein
VVEKEKRNGARVCTALPVALDGATGITRDVSELGVFLEMDAACVRGKLIRFTVEIATPARKMIFNCEGNVVRTEARETGMGVAVRINDLVMRFA